MACRSEEKAMQAVQEIKEKTKNDKVEFIKCDLSDWQTVVDFAKKIKERDLKIDVLLNNAGWGFLYGFLFKHRLIMSIQA